MKSTRIVLAFFFTILYEFGFCHPPPSTKKQVALFATAAGGDPDGLIGQHLPRVPPIADVDDATVTLRRAFSLTSAKLPPWR